MEPAISFLLSDEFLSSANPYLLQAEIAAAFLLGIGIIFESDKYPKSVHESAFWFVVIGVVLETVFSVLLFVSEEIETRNANTIAASAIERAAIATRAAEEDRLARVKIEDRLNRSLRGGMKEAIAASDPLKPFAGEKINLIAYPDDKEIEMLAKQIDGLLLRAGWIIFMPSGGTYTSPPIFDISVEVQVNRPNNHHVEAADALIKVLQDNRIGVGGPNGVFAGKTAAGDLQINSDALINIIIGKRW